MKDVLSTIEAARLTGIAPSSVKRWADQGLLPCVRTPGGHRRYDRLALEEFLRSRSRAASGPGEGWLRRLLGAQRHEVESALLEARARLGAWHRVADELGPVVTELGRSWEAGNITIAQEHLAADCLGRSLARVGEALPVRPDGPRCLLACAEGDEHTLALSFLQVCLRELDWVPVWLGRKTPTEEVVRVVRSEDAQLVALSASSASANARALKAIAERVGAACRGRDTVLVLGGNGAWPEHPRQAVRLRSFGAFNAFVSRMENNG
jgi:excisionase family DNA binding protein